MKFLDALLGRTKPKPAKLDALFALPGAAVALEVEAGLRPSGQAGVCFKPVAGGAFAGVGDEMRELLRLGENDRKALREEDDRYGYHWVVLEEPTLEELVTDIHMVNTTLEGSGFGPQLLCSVFGFRPADEGPEAGGPGDGEPEAGGPGMYLVYLYKRGTFYPFAPRHGERRDNELELRIRALLGDELPIEAELGRWFPIWGAPLS
jgi:hypothetical protein